MLEEYIYDVGNGARGGGEYIILRLSELAAAKAKKGSVKDQTAPQEAGLLDMLDERMIAYLHGRQHENAIQSVLNQPLPKEDLPATKGDLLLSIMGELRNAVGKAGSTDAL